MLDIHFTKGNTLVKVDFNKSYNPYCAYNEKFSCPLVPLENLLDTKVEAGEKSLNNLFMNFKDLRSKLYSFQQFSSLIYLSKWILICLLLGVLVGGVSLSYIV